VCRRPADGYVPRATPQSSTITTPRSTRTQLLSSIQKENRINFKLVTELSPITIMLAQHFGMNDFQPRNFFVFSRASLLSMMQLQGMRIYTHSLREGSNKVLPQIELLLRYTAAIASFGQEICQMTSTCTKEEV
jgi:hypothetical protein